MTAATMMQPNMKERVNRSELRQNQSEYLQKAEGSTVVVVTGRSEDEARVILDKKYFEGLLARLKATIETVEIIQNAKLFKQILKAAPTLEEDLRSGKLHSFEEVFGED